MALTENGATHSTTARSLRVAIVVMPFFGLERPALGPSLLQAALRRNGHECDLIYANHWFGRRIGVVDYERVMTTSLLALLGEWLFAAALHGEAPDLDTEYLGDMADELEAWDPRALTELRREATEFASDVATDVGRGGYDVIGFSSVFEQNLASLAVASRIRSEHSDTTIIFGGGNCEGEMGLALLESFDFVDIVVTGEADLTFTSLIDTLASGDDVSELPGIITRAEDGTSHLSDAAAPIVDLDELPLPDFTDFVKEFGRIDRSGTDLEAHLAIETSRGCWWGAHHHCTFCGLNGMTMSFRSKSPDRVIEEFDTLVARHGIDRFEIVDNILDMRYLRSVLPRLAQSPTDYHLFWEVKAPLTRRQIGLLAAAGVGDIQPGIESLSDDVLQLIDKGTDTLVNVQLLKWASEYGLRVHWNLIYGIPGENPESYREMAQLVDAITHLPPPTSCDIVRIDRFSPYHNDPDGYGLHNVRPARGYRFVYPHVLRLDRLAYYFDHEYEVQPEPTGYVSQLLHSVGVWRQRTTGRLLTSRDGDDVWIIDNRSGRIGRKLRLRSWKATVYLACDRSRSFSDLASILDHHNVSVHALTTFLEFCERHGFMLSRNNRHLALAVHDPPRPVDISIPDARLRVAVGRDGER